MICMSVVFVDSCTEQNWRGTSYSTPYNCVNNDTLKKYNPLKNLTGKLYGYTNIMVNSPTHILLKTVLVLLLLKKHINGGNKGV